MVATLPTFLLIVSPLTHGVLAEKVLNDETVRPGWLGFGVVVGLGLLTYLLIRSFLKQLRTMRANDERRREQERVAVLDSESGSTGQDSAPGG